MNNRMGVLIIPGPTGEYPQGKLSPDDNGEIAVTITRDDSGNVIMRFGTPVDWLGFDRDSARDICRKIMSLIGEPLP